MIIIDGASDNDMRISTGGDPAGWVSVVLAPCPTCHGSKKDSTLKLNPDPSSDRIFLPRDPCPDCLRDRDGNLTGYVLERRDDE